MINQMKLAKKKYDAFRQDAKKRGIKVHFTFEGWIGWWEGQLGPDWMSKRGCKRGQYVMARFKDEGDYEPSNVRCTTSSDNHFEYNVVRKPPNRNQRPKLTKEQAAQIFKAKGSHAEIAAQFGVGKHQVHCVKTQKYFKSTTDKLK